MSLRLPYTLQEKAGVQRATTPNSRALRILKGGDTQTQTLLKIIALALNRCYCLDGSRNLAPRYEYFVISVVTTIENTDELELDFISL